MSGSPSTIRGRAAFAEKGGTAGCGILREALRRPHRLAWEAAAPCTAPRKLRRAPGGGSARRAAPMAAQAAWLQQCPLKSTCASIKRVANRVARCALAIQEGALSYSRRHKALHSRQCGRSHQITDHRHNVEPGKGKGVACSAGYSAGERGRCLRFFHRRKPKDQRC